MISKTTDEGARRGRRCNARRWGARAAGAIALMAATGARAETAPLSPVPTQEPPTMPSSAPPAPPSYAPPSYAPPSYAPPAAWSAPICTTVSAPGAEEHDDGYVRLELGINSSVFRARGGGQTTAISGDGASMSIALGWVIAPNLVLYGKLMDAGASDPDVAGPGTTTFTRGDSDLYGVGPGLTYYLPGNFFVSATAMAARVSLSDSNDHTILSSGWGVAGDAVVGKEWWTSDNWGLGVSFQGILGELGGHAEANGVTPTWSASAWSLLFSATYN